MRDRYQKLVDKPDTPVDNRAKIDEDIKRFLAKGGKVTAVPRGYSKYSNEPMRNWVEESRKRKFGEV